MVLQVKLLAAVSSSSAAVRFKEIEKGSFISCPLSFHRDNKRLSSVENINGTSLEGRMGEFCGGTASRAVHERVWQAEDGRRAVQVLQIHFAVSHSPCLILCVFGNFLKCKFKTML